MSGYFVNRPVFAIVISLLISLLGILALTILPMEEYPDIAPPTINISATYTGASAETVENSVTQIIEQELTGLDGLLYFSSTSSSAGTARISVVFDQGTDPDMAQIQVTNQVQQVISRLPEIVQHNGVRVMRSQVDMFLNMSLYDELDRSTSSDMADYLISNLYDQISRIEGVGEVTVYGSRYAMRIWLNPTDLRAYNLTPADVISAIKIQNVQLSAGSIGALPAVEEQVLTATVTAQSMFQTPEQFRNIIVKNEPNGSLVRIKDVAKVELGSETYGVENRLNGHPAASFGLSLAPGANIMDTAARVYDLVEVMQKHLPEGYVISYSRDSSIFISRSVNEVLKTLFEAIALVVIVMFIFLGSWRATIIPVLTVPVVLLGTFAVLAVLGYTINLLTLFAMILAIGLLVDDTIVVVENVERVMREEGLGAKEATIASMKEVTSSLIGIAVVLSVVFLPMAFFGGATGVIYRQFSVTIITAMILSVIVAISLAPALCGILLVSHTKTGAFQRLFDRLVDKYTLSVQSVLKTMIRWLLSYGVITVMAVFIYMQLPTGFIPNEDQGGMQVLYTLPEGTDVKRTRSVARQIGAYFTENESHNVEIILDIIGINFNGRGQNLGMSWVKLQDWDLRSGRENNVQAIVRRATKALQQSVNDAQVFAIVPAPVRGLGQSGGFEIQLQASADMTRAELADIRQSLLAEAMQSDRLAAVRSGRTLFAPQLHVDFDQEKALAYGINLSDVYATLNTAWAGTYVNDFLDRSRIKRVYVQSDAKYRSRPEDLNMWTVRNNKGEMVPLGELVSTKMVQGIESVERYNGLASYQVEGSAAKGSSGEAMNEIASIADKLGAVYSWSGLSYQEKKSTGQAMPLYILSITVVFLCLAALYESWSIPISVLLIIPLGVIGVVASTLFRGLENNIYFQVALLATIGLSSKNAIMMITFMDNAVKEGIPLMKAAVEGAAIRMRPILMTSIAFIAGVLPLAVATGIGANSRKAIGTGIIGGTLTATFFALFFVPLFFVLVNRLFRRGE